jgi:hypothetical protein
LVGSTTTTSSSGTTGTITGTGGSQAYANTTSYGFAEHAAAYFKGADVSALSPEDRIKYESYYNTALVKNNVNEATFVTQIATVPLATSTYRTGANVSLYNFESGVELANTAQGEKKLDNGVTLKNYGTATNILQVRNAGTNDLFVADLKKVVGDPYWNAVVIPVYEGTKAAVSAAVAQVTTNGEATRPGVTAEMKAFWDVGVANGSFPVTEAGIQKAVEAYSAALTLAVIEAPASNKVVAAGAADGLRGETTIIPV